jgi:Ribonuclease G/E
MTIEPTAALVAIDLDLGGGSAGRMGKAASHAAANAAFIPELARAIRVRNLGGPIVTDLAGLSPRRRAALGPALAAALADDPLLPRFLGFSALGLAEILRPRVHPPLHELLASPHAAGLAALRALTGEAAAVPAHMPALYAAADVADALLADATAQADLARRCGRALVLRVDRALPPRAWRLGAA